MRNHLFPSHIKSVVLGTALAACIAVKPASATPATLGFYPATDVYGKGVFHYDADSYGKGFRTDSAVTTGLTYGIGPDRDGLFGRSEIGLDYALSLGGVTPTAKAGKRLLFNVKTQLYNNDKSTVRVVAGLWGVGSAAIGAPNVLYLTGSKSFGFGRVHAGIANSLAPRSSIVTGSNNATRTSLTLGYDRYITPKLQFAADFYSGKNFYAGIQPTLYYYVNDKADFGIGYFRLNDKNVAPSRNQIYLCFDYNFGGVTVPVVNSAPVPETAPAAPATN